MWQLLISLTVISCSDDGAPTAVVYKHTSAQMLFFDQAGIHIPTASSAAPAKRAWPGGHQVDVSGSHAMWLLSLV